MSSSFEEFYPKQICSICDESKTNHTSHTHKWGYTSEHYTDQTHEYIFCESCLQKMELGLPLPGKLKRFKKDDANLGWFPPNPSKMKPEELEKLHPDFKKKLFTLHLDA